MAALSVLWVVLKAAHLGPPWDSPSYRMPGGGPGQPLSARHGGSEGSRTQLPPRHREAPSPQGGQTRPAPPLPRVRRRPTIPCAPALARWRCWGHRGAWRPQPPASGGCCSPWPCSARHPLPPSLASPEERWGVGGEALEQPREEYRCVGTPGWPVRD